MAVGTTTHVVIYGGNASTEVFPVPFPFGEPTELLVELSVNGVSETLALDTDYLVTGSGYPNGGSVVLAVAPDDGDFLTITRVAPLTQERSLAEPYVPAEHQAALDKLTFLDQQAVAKVAALSEPEEANSVIGLVTLSEATDVEDVLADSAIIQAKYYFHSNATFEIGDQPTLAHQADLVPTDNDGSTALALTETIGNSPASINISGTAYAATGYMLTLVGPPRTTEGNFAITALSLTYGQSVGNNGGNPNTVPFDSGHEGNTGGTSSLEWAGYYAYLWRPSTGANLGVLWSGALNAPAWDGGNYLSDTFYRKFRQFSAGSSQGPVAGLPGDRVVIEVWLERSAPPYGAPGGINYAGNVEYAVNSRIDWHAMSPSNGDHPASHFDMTATDTGVIDDTSDVGLVLEADSLTTLEFSEVVLNTGSPFADPTRFTAPIAGNYLIEASASLRREAFSAGGVAVYLVKNGTVLLQRIYTALEGTNRWHHVSLQAQVHLAAGDYAQVQIRTFEAAFTVLGGLDTALAGRLLLSD